MSLRRYVTLGLLYALLTITTAYAVVLRNGYMQVTIAEDWVGTHPPGSLLEYTTFYEPAGNALANVAYAGKIESGSYIISSGIWEVPSQSEAIFVSSSLIDSVGGLLPVTTTIYYALVNWGLNITWRVECGSEVTFTEGLNWTWDLTRYDTLFAFNHFGQVDAFIVAELSDSKIRALRTAWNLSSDESSLWILQPVPHHGRWRVETGKLTMEWLYSREPITGLSASQYPKIASVLSPEHFIEGNIRIEVAQSDDPLPGQGNGSMFLSGMPETAEQGFIYMWDALPLMPDIFEPMTTSTNPATPVGSQIVHLLENHPRMKHVLLLGLDVICSGYPFRPTVPGWYIPQSFVCIDTMDQIEGIGALTVSHYEVRETWITQPISCIPGESLYLSGWIKVDSLSSGWTGLYLVGDASTIQPPAFIFTEASPWIYCESDVNTGPNTQLLVKVGMTGGPGKTYFDDLYFERPGTPENLLSNAGFDSFSFWVNYDGEGLEWWHAHGDRRIPVDAPEEYLEFLIRLENGTATYGWEDRVCLGMHSYHHTPNEFYPLGAPNLQEFNFYDPPGDSGRFYMIHRDLLECGLTDKSFKAVRFPGFKHHLPAIIECAKYGMQFVDQGYDYEDNCHLGVIIMPDGILWETNTNWWSDEDSEFPPEMMLPILNRGELILAGGHPISTFKLPPDSRFDIIDNIFTDLENQFPNMIYFFPHDFASFCEESRNWSDTECVWMDSSLEYRFYGSALYGQTIVAHILELSHVQLPPLIDDVPADYVIRQNRIFIPLPELQIGYHTVVLKTDPDLINIPPPPLPEKISINPPFPNPCNAVIVIPVELPHTAEVNYTFIDILGRTVLNGKTRQWAGYRNITLNVSLLSSGTYFYRIRAENVVKTGKLVLLK